MTILGIPLSLDPAALVLAGLALWVAWQVYRATTFHRAKIVSVNHSWNESGFPPNTTLNFDVAIRNTGLPIHEPSIHFAFTRYCEERRVVSTRIRLGGASDCPFEHGMQGRFGVKFAIPVPEAERVTISWLQCLAHQSPRQSDPHIVIKSGDFDVVSIRLVSRFYQPIAWWNRFANWVNSKFDRHGKFEDGQSYVRPGKVIPKIGLNAWWKLRILGEDAAREAAKISSEADRSQSA